MKTDGIVVACGARLSEAAGGVEVVAPRHGCQVLPFELLTVWESLRGGRVLATLSAEVHRAVAQLSELGLVMHAPAERRAAKSHEHRPTTVEAVVVVTRDREASVRRLLASIRGTCKRQRPSIVLVQDGEDSTSPVPDGVLCFHRSQREPYVTELARRSRFPFEDLRSHLAPTQTRGTISTGAARTFAQLLMADRRYFIADDDVALLPAQTTVKPVFSGFSDTVPGTRRIGRDRSVATDLGEGDDPLDYLAALMDSAVIDVCATTDDFDCPQLLGAASIGALNVPIVAPAVWGDGGAITPFWNLFHLNDEEYPRLRLDRNCDVIRSSNALSNSRAWLSVAALVDGTSPLPPFASIGRSQDSVFAALLTSMSLGHAIGHAVPPVLHLSGRPASFDEDSMNLPALAPQGNIVLAEAIVALRPQHRSFSLWSDAEWGRMGGALCWAASTGILRDVAAGVLRQRIHGLKNFCAALPSGSPRHEDATRVRMKAEETLAQGLHFPPRDYASESEFVRFASSFGRLLQAWPSIWAAARELREYLHDSTLRGLPK
jgi:hypothetical protein